MRETRARKQSGVKWYEAKPAMDVDDFRRLLARKGQAEAEHEAAQRAEEAEAAAEQAARPDTAMQPADTPHANGAVAMDTGEDDQHAAEAAGAAAGRDVAASFAASAALKQQEAAALADAQRALQVSSQALHLLQLHCSPFVEEPCRGIQARPMAARRHFPLDNWSSRPSWHRLHIYIPHACGTHDCLLSSAGEAGGEAAAARDARAAETPQGAGAPAEAGPTEDRAPDAACESSGVSSWRCARCCYSYKYY